MLQVLFDSVTFPAAESLKKGDMISLDDLAARFAGDDAESGIARLLEIGAVAHSDAAQEDGQEPAQDADSGAFVTEGGLDALTADLDALKKAELVEIAALLGIDAGDRTKAELTAEILDARAAKAA